MSRADRNIRILITGAGGCIGRQLFQRLTARGFVVVGLARSAAPDTELMECDLASPDDLGRALSLASPDLIIHAAGSLLSADPAGAVEGYHNNLFAMAQVLCAAIKQGVKRLIFLSSNMAYGASYQINPGQEAQCRPQNWYARSKVLCEQLLQDHASAIESTVLRLPSVIGSGMGRSENLVTQMVGELRDTGAVTVFGHGRARRQIIDISDLADVVCFCAESNTTESGFLLAPVVGREVFTILELARRLADLSGGGELRFDNSKPDSPDQFIDPEIPKLKLGCEAKTGLNVSLRAVLSDLTFRQHNIL